MEISYFFFQGQLEFKKISGIESLNSLTWNNDEYPSNELGGAIFARNAQH